MIQVEFIGVGRDHQSWTARLPEVSETSIKAAVRRRGAILAQKLAVNLRLGTIYAGQYTVGTFHIKGETK